ncbi:hypothetical protein [Bacillus wiedmannii]
MKKFATLLLSLFLLISAVAPSYAFAETGKTGWDYGRKYRENMGSIL